MSLQKLYGKKSEISGCNTSPQKENPWPKANYRPVSVLPTISKIFEKISEKQLNHYIQNHVSPSFCGYRKVL